MTCSFDSCPHPAVAKGLCGSHYQQSRRRGGVLTPLRDPSKKTVPIPGLRVGDATYSALVGKGPTVYLAACWVLEEWAKRRARRAGAKRRASR